MKRWLYLGYGVGNHLLFLAVYAWFAAFVGNFLIPKTIDTPSNLATGTAAAINIAVLLLFAAQHSIMARPAFKDVWTKIVPKPIERATYVLASCIVTATIMVFWCGMPGIVWDFQSPMLRTTMWVLFGAGWLLVPLVTLMINHFDLFGTRQVWLYFQGKEYTSLPFRTPALYARVRHPLYLGWALAFWATPTMTVGHFLFASVLTVYMIGAAVIEERDLIAHFGQQYHDYRRQVPMFVPRIKARIIDAQVKGSPGKHQRHDEHTRV